MVTKEKTFFFKEFVVFCTSAIEDFSHEAEAIYRVMVDQLKNLPIFANFEEEFKALTNVELFQAIENFYSEIVFAAKDLMDAPEVNELTENLGYLLKVILKKFFFLNRSTVFFGFSVVSLNK